MQTPPLRRAASAAACALVLSLAAPLATDAQLTVSSIYVTVGRPMTVKPVGTIDRVQTGIAPALRPSSMLTALPAPRPAVHREIDTLSFAYAALSNRQIERVPALEEMSNSSRDQVVATPMLVGAAAELRAMRASASVIQLLDRTASSLDAMCAEADGNRRRACRSLTIHLTAARAHLRAGRKPEARRSLSALAKQADEAVQQGVFAQWEGTVIGETAKYAMERM